MRSPEPPDGDDAPAAVSLDANLLWKELHPDAAGLVPCVVQDLRTLSVLMLAWVSKDALAQTLSTGLATFWSRSRQTLWQKGERSGHKLRIVHVRHDCDADTLLYLVEASGPACHEGHATCFSRRRIGNGWRHEPELPEVQNPGDPAIMADLERIIDARAATTADSPRSYTRKLLDGGVAMQGAKIREEAEELVRALGAEPAARVASEAADLLYHLAVALKGRDVPMAKVFEVLARRFALATAGGTDPRG